MDQPTATEVENAHPRPDVMDAFTAVLGGLLTLPEMALPTMVGLDTNLSRVLAKEHVERYGKVTQ